MPRLPKILPWLLAVASLLSAFPVAASAQVREVIPLETGWQFTRGDQAGAGQPVSVPHTFNAEGEGADATRHYRGPTWYRRELDLAALPGTRTFIEFDGANLVTEAWLNGHKIGRHEGGYARFRFDLTPHLKAGKNRLAVRVDNSKREHIAPLGGDFTQFGGIYRPVRLITTRDVHFDMLDYGSPGVYVTPRDVTDDSARLDITTRVHNSRRAPATVTVSVQVLDAQGTPVLAMTQPATLAANETARVELSGTVAKPRLWNGVADPYLYTTRVEILQPAADIRDSIDIATGLRDIRVDADRGLLLNGKPYDVHGPNLHLAMRPGKTVAVSNAEIEEDIALFQDMGATALRLAHYQHDPHTYTVADRQGLLLWTEAPFVSEISGSDAFLHNASQQLRELIRQNYNHASVFMWGLGNEIYKVDANSARVLDAMQKLAHAEDATRPTAYANCCGPIDGPQAMHTDLVGSNVYFGWYSGEFSELGPWLDKNHKVRPATPQAISEYGAGASVLHQQDPPVRPQTTDRWHPEQYQTLYHEAAWRQLRDRSWLWGKFIWVGIDFPSAGRNEGASRGFNNKGLVTYDRKTKKDAYFWYQANWTTRPMVYITSRRFTARSTPDVDVKVYTNQPSVTLRVNGVAQPVQTPDDHVAVWRVSLQPGRNLIETTAGDVGDSIEWIFQPESVN